MAYPPPKLHTYLTPSCAHTVVSAQVLDSLSLGTKDGQGGAPRSLCRTQFPSTSPSTCSSGALLNYQVHPGLGAATGRLVALELAPDTHSRLEGEGSILIEGGGGSAGPLFPAWSW